MINYQLALKVTHIPVVFRHLCLYRKIYLIMERFKFCPGK